MSVAASSLELQALTASNRIAGAPHGSEDILLIVR